jgi:hypothetical protein
VERDVVFTEPGGLATSAAREVAGLDGLVTVTDPDGRILAATEARLRQRARHTGILLAAAFADARVAPGTPLAVVDPAGSVVLANTDAAALLGTPADVPAFAPTHRWTPQFATLPRLVRRAVERARQDSRWAGSTQIFVPFLAARVPVSVRPVSAGTQVIGLLLAFGSPGGNPPFGSARTISSSVSRTSALSPAGWSPCGTTGGSCSTRARSALPRLTATMSG